MYHFLMTEWASGDSKHAAGYYGYRRIEIARQSRFHLCG